MVSAGREVEMKCCGHSEEGEAAEGLLAGTLHDLTYAL